METVRQTVQEIRQFNRFYTVNMGFLDASYLNTAYSMPQTRIMFEIRARGRCIQSDITRALHIDKSYLSRLIRGLEKNGLVQREPSQKDKRASYLSLTKRGEEETARLVRLTDEQIGKKIGSLSAEECFALCDALKTVIAIMGKDEQL